MRTPAGTRNVSHVDVDRDPYTFALALGRRVDLIAETHTDETTTLTLRRRPRLLLEDTK